MTCRVCSGQSFLAGVLIDVDEEQHGPWPPLRYVQRCTTCAVYPSDLDAARAVADYLPAYTIRVARRGDDHRPFLARMGTAVDCDVEIEP